MVMGARSTIFLSLRGGGPLPTTGTCWVNTHREFPGRDSSLVRAFSNAKRRSRRNTKPTKYWDSLEKTVVTELYPGERGACCLPGDHDREAVMVCALQ